MQNNHQARKPDHQHGGVQRAQAVDTTLNTGSRPANKHRDPGALDPECKPDQDKRSEQRSSSPFLSGERLEFGDALSLPNESSPRELKRAEPVLNNQPSSAPVF
jgi:hypothetical protein